MSIVAITYVCILYSTPPPNKVISIDSAPQCPSCIGYRFEMKSVGGRLAEGAL